MLSTLVVTLCAPGVRTDCDLCVHIVAFPTPLTALYTAEKFVISTQILFSFTKI